MPDSVPTFPGRFREVARYYSDGRPYYPPLLARHVAQRVGLSPASGVLDLGTGPGFLAIDFAQYAGTVIGIDPEPNMLNVAQANAALAGFPIRFLQGYGETLDDSLGTFRLITIGRAFHWMDRPAVLARFDRLIEPGGGVALFEEKFPDVEQNAWRAPFQAVLDRYAQTDPARDLLRDGKNHENVLLRSPFAHVERIAVIEHRRTPFVRFVDRALSFARAWGGALDAPPAGLTKDVRAALAPFVQDEVIDEVICGEAIVAFRPGDVTNVPQSFRDLTNHEQPAPSPGDDAVAQVAAARPSR